MPDKELEDYVKVQRSLGVSDAAIKKSLLNAGYEEPEFKELLERHQHRIVNGIEISSKYLLYLNIMTIIAFALLFLYFTDDYNKKISNLSVSYEDKLTELNTTIRLQTDSINTQVANQGTSMTSAIDSLRRDLEAANNNLRSEMQNNNYQSLNRDTMLSDSIQKISNHSLTELSGFQKQLKTVQDASTDFSPIIPKAINAVVTIGKKEQGFFVTAGSGVIINANGYIVTNYHVIDQLQQIMVQTHDGNAYTATVVGKDAKWDVAVIKLVANNTDFTYLEWADSDAATVGEHVIAVGNPVGLESTVTEGIISNTKRLIPGEMQIYYLQTDVAINAGNSGGPLIDKDGNILGIATMKYSKTGFEGLSFALRSNDVKGVVLKMLQNEKMTQQ
jgi:S1-C subfamily serine protease